MNIFRRTVFIDVDLEDLTMEKVMYFPKKGDAGLEEFHINKVFNQNHIQIGVVQSRVYTSGIHDFEYDPKEKKIRIFSRYNYSAFLLYGYLLVPAVPLYLNKNSENRVRTIGIAILLFMFLSLMLIIVIRSESKEIEREMVIRINYLRRTMK